MQLWIALVAIQHMGEFHHAQDAIQPMKAQMKKLRTANVWNVMEVAHIQLVFIVTIDNQIYQHQRVVHAMKSNISNYP